ncbi:MAG: formate dehydrogenase-N subunit alpha, partial [Deltaproteobacteria bacterium]|nr:formate dehydrogenase-N subunit alpha [Deltaproteobacteria bacterium]
MELSRRGFLKVTGGAAAGLSAATLGVDLRPAYAFSQQLRTREAKEHTTICQFCAVGCGMILHSSNGKAINIEGDPDHPINEGTLCTKGAASRQFINSERRVSKVLYRSPNSDRWEEKSWDWALDQVAGRIKDTRDRTFITRNEKGNLVNRTEAIAMLGGAPNTNEECYAWSKLDRALGLVYIDHQARVCHSSTVPALAESFGRGAMTNHWIDIGNSDCVMVIGSNAAETHPSGFRWAIKAKEKGAKLISVDPRFTRTSSLADIYAPMRSGTDIAFIGGLINYALENELYHKEYVVEYTDASFLVNPEFKTPTELDGVFSGLEGGKYNNSTWSFQLDKKGIPIKDKTLQHPNCVFQLLKRHFSRYTVDKVTQITGTPKDAYLKVAETFCATGKPGKVGTIMYAMGATQHTVGTQNIRSYAILQLLLGNIGLAGGGINALRGHANVQGSTDHAIMFHILPGYLKIPVDTQQTLAQYNEANTPKTNDPMSANWWSNYPKYSVSLLKAFYGDRATPKNDFAYPYIPKIDLGKDYSHISIFEVMYKGTIKGFILMAQNPAVSGPNARMEREALKNLDWLVVSDAFETETAAFWKAPGINPKEVKTEVFLLPSALFVEKPGSVTNSGRWSQWRNKASDPPGEVKNDLQIATELVKRLKALYAQEGGALPGGIIDLNWDHGDDFTAVAKDINGYALKAIEKDGEIVARAGDLVPGFAFLKEDGSTSSGNWIYCASFTVKGNMAARRVKDDPSSIGLYPQWAWCWPVNRRILYNRASVDLEGKPWDKGRPVIRWNPEAKKWIGDVPDGAWPPGEKHPFIMRPSGYAHLFGPGLKDGPFPEHYEPLESPLKNPISSQQVNPVIKRWDKLGSPMSKAATIDSPDYDKYPIVATTYRLSEHHHTGSITRNTPWLAELQPELFAE